jgi:DNA-directed RNA polymerase subunit RPC12/RpoP
MSDFMTCPRCHEEYLALGSAGASTCPKCGARNVAERLKPAREATGNWTCGKCHHSYTTDESLDFSQCPKCHHRNKAPRGAGGGGGLFIGVVDPSSRPSHPPRTAAEAMMNDLNEAARQGETIALARRRQEDPKVKAVAFVSFFIGLAAAIVEYANDIEKFWLGALTVGFIVWGLAKAIIGRIAGTSPTQWRKRHSDD